MISSAGRARVSHLSLDHPRSNHAQTPNEHSSESFGAHDLSIIGERVSAIGCDSLSARAQVRRQPGVVRPLSEVKFPSGEGPDCLQFFLETGDLKTGPSTAIMKAAPKCVVPPHYHTAEEQLFIVKGNVSTGMHAGYRSRPRRLRHDAKQATSLVHLHRQRRMPNVCKLRPSL